MLRVAFVGLGAISHEHVLGYLDSPAAEIVAVCCPEEEKEVARRWLQKWNLADTRYYACLDAMLQSEKLDLVEILTPTYLHAPHAIACARAGIKGISLQKPMGLTLRECDDIIETCRRHGTTLKVFENYLFYPAYVKAKELIDQGVIGELMSLRLQTAGGLREGAAWPWCWAPRSRRLNLKTAGVGPLTGDDGYHKLSLARWFMGRDFDIVNAWIEPFMPLDAPAFIRAKYRTAPGDCPKYAQFDTSFSTHLAIPWDFWIDDFAQIVGSKGIMWINQCQGGADRAFFKGNSMSKSPVFPPIAVYVNGRVETFLDTAPEEERSWSISFINSTKHFIKVLQEGGNPICTGEDGRETLRYALASLLSAQERRDVSLEEITTEAEVNKKFQIRTIFCNPGRTGENAEKDEGCRSV
jgi:predicted dehydrogenase